MTALFHCMQNDGPVLLNFPHSGIFLPPKIANSLNQRGNMLPDTDWHVPKLYGFAKEQVSWLEATHSRYVVDLNRDPDGANLYPGQAGTDICPVTDFAGADIYREQQMPDIKARTEQYFRPYHTELSAQIERILSRHGVCILLDCHSILGQVPRLFDGQLPDLNLGTFSGASCDTSLAELAATTLQTPEFPFVRDGRFTGGWITRQYGQPSSGVHALQLEIAQSCYMDENQIELFDLETAAPLQRVLRNLINNLNNWNINTRKQ
ncbi:N-formylglutamate deformylase [hydrothermal vent metagenome]|uniref:N-formylglutamate deformylase n=1 Tax=hydrothermal vent metagenome TaxID=652676 RepID=A0A3B0SJP4_9ZZZZ